MIMLLYWWYAIAIVAIVGFSYYCIQETDSQSLVLTHSAHYFVTSVLIHMPTHLINAHNHCHSFSLHRWPQSVIVTHSCSFVAAMLYLLTHAHSHAAMLCLLMPLKAFFGIFSWVPNLLKSHNLACTHSQSLMQNMHSHSHTGTHSQSLILGDSPYLFHLSVWFYSLN